MQIIHIYIISSFKCKERFTNNIWEYECSFFPYCFLLIGGTVNQVFHGVSCVLVSTLSAVWQSNFLRVLTATFHGGMVYQTTLVQKDSTCSHPLWKENRRTFPKQHILRPKFESHDTFIVHMLVQLSSPHNEMSLCTQIIHSQKNSKIT